jgi:exodeoxyribonuclease V gamma subunit
MTIYFSNQLEILLEHLKVNLFKSSKARSLFAKRLLVVPNRTIDAFIRLKMADDPHLSSATGFKTLHLNSFVDLFSEKRVFPTELELTLRIEKEISKIRESEAEERLWAPLISYLEKKDKRLMPLCAHLARYFAKFALYGWQEKSQENEKWQQQLWNRVFIDGNPFAQLLEKELEQVKGHSIHLFGFNHLSDFHFTLLQKIEKTNDLNIYHASPCQEFWSDIKGDKEISSFLKVQSMDTDLEAHLEELLSDRNPLLANFGRVQRQFATYVEESGFKTHEDYGSPDGQTNLARMQNAILTLTQEKKDQPQDDSIQVHFFPTPFREIEGLYHQLHALIAREGMRPSDIAVFAPDITLYAPFIRSVFGSNIPYQIQDLSLLDKNGLIQGLLCAVDLEKKRWSCESVFELVYEPFFRQKWNLSEDDLKKIEKWVAKAHIRWGFNQEHVKKITSERNREDVFDDSNATWECGIDRILCHLATQAEVAFTEVEILQTFILALRPLYNTLKGIHDEQLRTIEQWACLFEELAKSHFVYEESEMQMLQETFFDLKIADIFKRELSCHSFLFLLKTSLSKKNYTEKKHHLEVVQFASLGPMRILPSKVICLIGMNQGAFPGKENATHLDLLKGTASGKKAPSRGDLDRSTFLDVLVMARYRLYLSFIGRSAIDQTLLPPASCVESLKIDKWVEHPLFGFDPKYFAGHGELVSSSLQDFKAATYFLNPLKSAKKFNIAPVQEELESGIHHLNLQDLVSAVRNPLRLFFREKLNISLKKEESCKEDEEFVISALMMKKLKQESLKKPFSVVLSEAIKKGNFPLHAFKAVAALRVKDEIEDLKEALEDHQLSGEDLQQVVFDHSQGTHLPIRLALDEKRAILLSGIVEGCTEKGMVVFEKCQLKTASRLLPSLLMLNTLGASKIIFCKDGKEKGPFFDKPETLLKDFCEYFFVCKNSPSLLFPSWIEPILRGEKKLLEKVMNEECYEEELKFAQKYDMLPSSHHIIEAWQPWAQKLYSGVYNAWF